MNPRFSKPTFILVLMLATAVAGFTQSTQWRAIGPDGGDVRSLAYDPHNPDRILLGTSAGQLYVSNDKGNTWERWSRIGKGNDYVLDNVIFDPEKKGTIYVAAWTVEREGGGMYKTTDNGKTWTSLKDMDGKSIRALAMSASDHKMLTAGALDGVFRSFDGGESWQRISPANHPELKNFESIAVDPKDPQVVYAGTWHLAWKTTDGGKNWHQIKNGVIDDSDVFSLIIDPRNTQVVYLSACSGIYKSENAGELFHKVQGMPFSARRTRVLQMDPLNSTIVYAGTTEGLWKTVDAGHTWSRMTQPNVIVNDVMVDPRSDARVLLATDRSGVLASDNEARTFVASNAGFAHRQVSAMAADTRDPQTIYAGVVNDKEYGGVFVTHDGGTHWQQMSTGLDGRDVFVLRQTHAGSLIAGTNKGVMEFERAAWHPLNHVVNEREIVVRKATKKTKAVTKREAKAGEITGRVADINVDGDKMFAAASSGLYESTDGGHVWRGGPVLGHSDFIVVRASGNSVMATGTRSVLVSNDAGRTWKESKLPDEVTIIRDAAFGPEDTLYVAAREGAYQSKDGGQTWRRVLSLPVVNLASITWDDENRRLLITSLTSTELLASYDNAHSWKRIDSGWLLRSTLENDGRLWASTAFDGVVVWDGQRQATVARGGSVSNTSTTARK